MKHSVPALIETVVITDPAGATIVYDSAEKSSFVPPTRQLPWPPPPGPAPAGDATKYAAVMPSVTSASTAASFQISFKLPLLPVPSGVVLHAGDQRAG
jgi:hypothetical protein